MYSLKSTLGLVATLYFVTFVGIVFCNEEAIRQNATENDSGEVYNDIFVPTKEWQKVPKGQAIPPGLHVRMNIQTGETEAKLLDESDKEDKSTSNGALVASSDTTDDENDATSRYMNQRMQHMQQAMEDVMRELEGQDDLMRGSEPVGSWEESLGATNKRRYTREDVQEALRKMKASGDDVQHPTDGQRPFRNIDEIKRDFAELNMDIKTDNEILTGLLADYRKMETVNEKMALLADLEYMLHQVDNAVNFVDQGGLDLLVADFNHSDHEVRSEAIRVLTSATQGNPKVQIKCVETGILSVLVRQLTLETNDVTRGRVLSAISALIRQFPLAQEKFVTQGGLQALVTVYSSHATGDKFRLKTVTLLHDLLLERSSTATDEQLDKSAVLQSRLEQYNKVPLLSLIAEHGWCERISTLLSLSDHDAREKVLHTMVSVQDVCGSHFAGLSDTLAHLHKQYSHLAATETDGDDYFSSIVTLIGTVQDYILKYRPREDL